MGQGIAGIVRPGPKNSMYLCSVGVSLILRVGGGFFFVPKGQSTRRLDHVDIAPNPLHGL